MCIQVVQASNCVLAGLGVSSPPLVPNSLHPSEPGIFATGLLQRIDSHTQDAKDNLMLAKITQSYHANKRRAPEVIFHINDKVMLSTLHRRHEYQDKNRVACHFGAYLFPPIQDVYYTCCSPVSLVFPVVDNRVPERRISFMVIS
ncbi:hypothetical protein IW261DRAFT_672892 [Armillaria novae-zelandiae]|uniref:Uncharacterized protein n=1 Tax=Armillaria novae-zelandiae TaxID=153914 RepID=A0AA39T9G0_9AGAR|nr:hypothetical protein IW261DRAFT_672892 [Armillaria novae-zelandiae]